MKGKCNLLSIRDFSVQEMRGNLEECLQNFVLYTDADKKRGYNYFLCSMSNIGSHIRVAL